MMGQRESRVYSAAQLRAGAVAVVVGTGSVRLPCKRTMAAVLRRNRRPR